MDDRGTTHDAVPIRVEPASPAGSDPASWVPPGGLRAEGTGADAGSTRDGAATVNADESLNQLRAGGSGETFTGVGAPAQCVEAAWPEGVDGD